MRFLSIDSTASLAVVLAALVLVRLLWRRRAHVATTASWLAARPYRASILRRLPLFLLLTSLALLGVALLDPVLPYSQVTVESNGLDIVLAVDLSSSMQDEMVKHTSTAAPKTRLDSTKDALRTFIQRRRDDRIGVVVFSENAYVISPLTLDREYLLRYVDLIDNQMLRGEGMTAIGEGLALSNVLLTREAGPSTRGKVVVLFTDGENTAGREPLPVLAQSRDAGIRVHLVAIALEEQVRQKPQVKAFLQEIRRFGGRQFDANSAGDLEAASRAIDQIEKGTLVSRAYQRDVPVFQWFALPALMCLAAAFALRAVPQFIDLS